MIADAYFGTLTSSHDLDSSTAPILRLAGRLFDGSRTLVEEYSLVYLT
jgi:hypothetical protein